MKSCLIVDDVRVSRYTSGVFLQELGFEIIEAQNSEETRNVLKKKPVDAILLDWHIKKENGLELLKEIRESVNGKSAHIVVFSGIEGQERASEALAAGANDFIVKPTDKDKIKSAFKKGGLI